MLFGTWKLCTQVLCECAETSHLRRGAFRGDGSASLKTRLPLLVGPGQLARDFFLITDS